MTTLLDLQQKHGTVIDKQIVDELALTAPEITRIPSMAIAGTTYQYRKRRTAPRIGYRPANAGIGMQSTHAELKVDSCYLLQAMIGVDKAMAEGYPGGWTEVLAEEVQSHTQGILFSMGLQFWYGKSVDPDGSYGILDGIGDYMTLHADPAKNEDTKANRDDNAGASAFFIVEDPRYLRMIYGGQKGISFSPTRDADISVPDKNGNPATLPCKVKDVSSWHGLSVRSDFAVVRIKGITAANPLTDDKLAEALSFFPAGIKPTALYMNPYVRRLLQIERSKKLVFNDGSSTETAAPMPKDYEGIPIVVTDALLNDESPESLKKVATISTFTTPRVATLKK